MFTEQFTELLLASLSGGTFLAGILTTYRWYKDRQLKKYDPFNEVLPKVHQIYSIIEKLRRDLKAKRVAILKAENGGGIPKIDSHLYSSILYETVADTEEKVKATWQKQKVDKAYVELLMDVYQKGEVTLCEEELPTSILKDVYNAYGTNCAVVLPLSTAYNKFMYLTVHFDDIEQLDTMAETLIRSAVNDLSRIFDNNKMI